MRFSAEETKGIPSFNETPGHQETADMDAWFQDLAAMIDDLGRKRFPETLIRGLCRLVGFEMAAIFVYRGRSRPLHIYDDFHPAEAKKGIEAYVEGTYVLNPFYQAYLNGLEEGVYLMQDLVPNAQLDSSHYGAHRVSLSSHEEIGYITDHWPKALVEMDIAIFLDKKVMVEITISRSGKGAGFSESDLARVKSIFPTLAALVRKQLRDYTSGGPQDIPPDSRIDDAFMDFGREVLTDRECEVVQMILRGYSSESIGQTLNISLGTVKTHRKNAYAKMQISSQSELLSLFLKSLSKI